MSPEARLWLIITLLCMPASVLANTCDALKVTGGAHWFPYFFNELPKNEAMLSTTQRDSLRNRNGIIGDIVMEAAERARVKVTITQPKPWRRILFDLSRGQVDVLAGALKTDERAKIFDFSKAVHNSEFRVFVHKDRSFEFNTLDDLKGRSGLKLGGMSFGKKVDDYAFEHLILEDVSLTSSLFEMLKAKRADYAIFYHDSGLDHISELGLTETVIELPTIVSREPIYIAFSRETRCPQLVAKIQAEINTMLEDGSVAGISNFYDTIINSPPDARYLQTPYIHFAFEFNGLEGWL